MWMNYLIKLKKKIFLFVSDIEPILNEINTSIKDNLKKMPKASKQLSKVTEATEMATTEILDILELFPAANDDVYDTSSIDDLAGAVDSAQDAMLDDFRQKMSGSKLAGYVPGLALFAAVFSLFDDAASSECASYKLPVSATVAKQTASFDLVLPLCQLVVYRVILEWVIYALTAIYLVRLSLNVTIFND